MIRFWFEVFLRATTQTLSAIGKDPADLEFSVVVVLIATLSVFLRDGLTNGWKDMKKRLSAIFKSDLVLVLGLGLLVFVCQFFKTPSSMWNEEHSAYVNADDGKRLAQNNVDYCTSNLKGEIAKEDLQKSQLSSQQGVINSQQGTVNSLQGTLSKQQAAVTTCVGDLAKAIIPEPPKTTLLLLPTHESHQNKHTAYLMLLTNKQVTPIHLAVWCDAYVSSFEVAPADGSAYGGSTEKAPGDSVANVFITFPTWTPDNPLLVQAHYDSDELGKCHVKPL